MLEQIKERANRLKRQLVALHLAAHDPRTPWGAKVLVLCVLGYALSPIDLIPDFIPILGYLDDLILVPLGIYLAIKLIPRQVWADCQVQASQRKISPPRSRTAAGAIVIAWLAAMVFLGYFVIGRFSGD